MSCRLSVMSSSPRTRFQSLRARRKTASGKHSLRSAQAMVEALSKFAIRSMHCFAGDDQLRAGSGGGFRHGHRLPRVGNPRAAAELGQRIFATIDKLAANEFDGTEQILTTGEVVRSWAVPPVRIYYQRELDTFWVLRIYHRSRYQSHRRRSSLPHRTAWETAQIDSCSRNACLLVAASSKS